MGERGCCYSSSKAQIDYSSSRVYRKSDRKIWRSCNPPLRSPEAWRSNGGVHDLQISQLDFVARLLARFLTIFLPHNTVYRSTESELTREIKSKICKKNSENVLLFSRLAFLMFLFSPMRNLCQSRFFVLSNENPYVKLSLDPHGCLQWPAFIIALLGRTILVPKVFSHNTAAWSTRHFCLCTAFYRGALCLFLSVRMSVYVAVCPRSLVHVVSLSSSLIFTHTDSLSLSLSCTGRRDVIVGLCFLSGGRLWTPTPSRERPSQVSPSFLSLALCFCIL